MNSKTAAGYREYNKDKTTQLQMLAATDDQVSFITPKTSNHRLFIQTIVCSITTYAAVTWLFKDTTGTPIPIYFISIPAAAPTTAGDSSGHYRIDFGAEGVGLGVGQGLTLDVSAAGAAGMIKVEAYERLANAVAAATTN